MRNIFSRHAGRLSSSKEDDFLASKYVEYRKAFNETEAFAPFMSYGWFKPPQTIRLDSKLDVEQMAYQVPSDAISSLRS